MKLLFIFGPQACGKMTVGLEVAKLTGMKLFHNHRTIEMLVPMFDFDTPQFKTLNHEFRARIFEEAATSDMPGLIFTFVWALELPVDKAAVDEWASPFKAVGADIYYAELAADKEERLRRNRTPFRLQEKPTKRDIEGSDRRIHEWYTKYRFNTDADFPFFYPDQHVKIDNTHLSAEQTAQQIVNHFNLNKNES